MLHGPQGVAPDMLGYYHEAVEMLLAALENRHPGAAAIVALNAGAAIYVSGRAASLMEGVAQAQRAIASCAARDTLEHYRRFSQS